MARLTPETKRFLRKAVAGLPFLKRSEAKDELRAHLEDAIQHRIAQGAEHARAEQESVASLGDAAVLNRELLRSHCGYSWPFFLLRSKFYKRAIQSAGGQLRYKGRREWTKIESQSDRVRVEQTVARAERKLASRGPSYRIHERLGTSYSALAAHERKLANRDARTGGCERAQAHVRAAEAYQERTLAHNQAAADWLITRSGPWDFIGGRQRLLAGAYSQLAISLETMGRHGEAESAVRAGLAVDDEFFGLNFQQATYCLKRGDIDGAFQHLEASLDDDLTVGELGKIVLVVLQADMFDPLREDARFSRLLDRAHAFR